MSPNTYAPGQRVLVTIRNRNWVNEPGTVHSIDVEPGAGDDAYNVTMGNFPYIGRGAGPDGTWLIFAYELETDK